MGLQPGTTPGLTAPQSWQPGQPPPPGFHVSPDGNSLISDSTGATVATGGQAAGSQINGNDVNANNPNSNTWYDKVFNDNPVGGTINSANDLAHGDFQKAGGDFTQGYTYGTIPLGGDHPAEINNDLSKLPGTLSYNGQLLAGDAAEAARNAVDTAGGYIKKAAGQVGDVLGGAPDPSTSPLDNISTGALASQQELDARRRTLEDNPTAAPQAGLVQLDQTNIDPLRQRQGVALDQLQAAANGTLPSAAELAAQAAANRASAQAYGNAAALQGGASSGGALRQALDAGTQAQGDIQTKLLADRAAEQATARQQLVQGIGNAQQQEGTLATSNANLAQQTGLANQTADVNTRSQDITREQNLIGGANTDTSNATAAAKAALDAKVQEQANANALKGAEISGGANIIGNYFKSDRTAKEHVGKADLVELAEVLPGHTFEYKNPADGPGPRVGVMAQDAQKSRLGAQMVHLGDDGDLVLDNANAVGAALAMSAQALRDSEAAKKKRKA